MAKFISSSVISSAAHRLIDSKARSGFVDFLVLKRALKRSGGDEIPFSSTDADFTGAMRDLASSYPDACGKSAPTSVGPFVKVFGTAGAVKYVTKKWVTNGPADTLSGPKWSAVVEKVGTKPRRAKLQAGYESLLHSLVFKADGDIPKLVDAATWYHRATDLEAQFGRVPVMADLRQLLADSFVAALGLTSAELGILFDTLADPLAGLDTSAVLQDTPADPGDYLPDLETGSGNLKDLVPAFITLATKKETGLHVSESLLLRFAAALGSKRFLILGGLAGSGKTKLAQAFARWLAPAADDRERAVAVIPVGADWTGSDAILGYPDGIDPTRYVTRPALDLIQRAALPENTLVPHFLILDEMNLSHVERYFADVLSLIESGDSTELYRPEMDEEDHPIFRSGVEPSLRLPANLFIIGTVNVDETTYMFSPKVLDRANVIEFRVSRKELASFLDAPRSPSLDAFGGRGSGFGSAFVTEATNLLVVPKVVSERFNQEALLCFDLLQKHNAEFGFRVVNEAARFLHFFKELGGDKDKVGNPIADDVWFNAAMDAVIVQKLLPKLHGSRTKLEGLLWALGYACGADRGTLKPDDFLKACQEAGEAQNESKYSPEAVHDALKGAEARYPLSFDKILRMYRKLVRDQFVTFAEA